MSDRREFIRRAGLGALAAAAAPAFARAYTPGRAPLSPLDNLSASAVTAADELPAVNRTLERLTMRAGGGSPFTYIEQLGTNMGVLRLLDAAASLLTIVRELGLSNSFSGRPSFREASQCRKFFQQHHEYWANYYRYFTDVQRAPADRDVAYMVTGNTDSSNYIQPAQGSTQFRNTPAVSIAGDDPGVLLAVSTLLKKQYAMSERDVAHNLALVKKEPLPLGDGGYGTRYETPSVSIMHDPRPRRNVRRSRGLVAVHNKRDRRKPDNLYYAGVYV